MVIDRAVLTNIQWLMQCMVQNVQSLYDEQPVRQKTVDNFHWWS